MTHRKTILVADDEPKIVTVICRTMQILGYHTVPATCGAEAVTLAQKEHFALLLLDEKMPDMTGTEALTEIRHTGASSRTPAIMITAFSDKKTVSNAIRRGADDFLVKPFRLDDLVSKVNLLIHQEVNVGWEELSEEQTETLTFTLDALDHAFSAVIEEGKLPFAQMKEATSKVFTAIGNGDIKGILAALRKHDNYTYVHSLRVAVYMNLMGALYDGLTDNDLLIITTGGLVHDVGKARIPLDVLNKPAALDKDEYDIMMTHVTHSAEILRHSDNVPTPVIEIAWSHHEKIDGSGYPRGLKGDAIDIFGRMAAVVDAFVALTDERVYKPSYSHLEALAKMSSQKGHFDQSLLIPFRDAVLDAKWEE